jgi:hypothetical protein
MAYPPFSQSFPALSGASAPFTLDTGLYWVTFNAPASVSGSLDMEYEQPSTPASFQPHSTFNVMRSQRAASIIVQAGRYRLVQGGSIPCDVTISELRPVQPVQLGVGWS